MQWLLTRPGQQQEGPYEEGQIIEMIRNGQLQAGYIATPGGNQWWALNEHPPFAHALAAAQQPQQAPGHYPAQNPQGGYQQPGYGGPQGQPAGAMPPAGGAQPAATKQKSGGKMGLILGLGAGLIVLLGVGAAAAYFFLFTSSGSQISALVPKDTEVYVEFPDLPHALVAASQMDVLDSSKLESKKQIDELSKGLRESFEVDKDVGENVILSMRSIGFVGRDLERDQQFAALVRFSDSDAVEKWLAADRFSKEGKFGNNGEQYFVDVEKAEDRSGFSAYRSFFSGMQARKDGNEVLVWFKDAGLLAIGHKDLVDDVDSTITDDAGSLAKSEAWGQTEFERDAVAIAFVSPTVLDSLRGEDEKKIVRGYFDGIKPFTAALRLTSAGPVLSIAGQAKGNKVGEDDMLSQPVPLTLHNKLPGNTVMYVAAGGKRTLDGKALQSRIVKELEGNDEQAAKQFESALDEMDKQIGLDLPTVLDAIGNEVAFGFAVDPALKLDLEKPPKPEVIRDQVAAVFLMGVGDQEKANKLLKVLRVKGFEEGPMQRMYDIKKKGEGFVASPKPAEAGQVQPPLIDVSFADGVLIMAVGGEKMVEGALSALSGTQALGGVAAHKLALDSMASEPSAVAWMDTGRIAQTLLDALPSRVLDDVSEVEKSLGISRDVLRRTGDQRVTSALAFRFEAQPTEWNYRFESLNAPGFGLLAAMEPMVDALEPKGPALPIGDVPDIPDIQAPFIPNTGVVFCDSLLSVQHNCGQRINDVAMQTKAKEQASVMRLQIQSDPAFKAKVTTTCRESLTKFFVENPKCGIGAVP